MKAHRFGGLELSVCKVVIPYVRNIFSRFKYIPRIVGILTTQVFAFDCRNTVNSL